MIEYFIDYFRITIHKDNVICRSIYNRIFRIALGKLIPLDHGAKGYKGVMKSALGFQLKHTPGGDKEYCTFELPGQVCKAVPPEFFNALYRHLNWEEIKYNVNRMDLAFDFVPFTPLKFMETIIEDHKNPERNIVRSLTQRNSLKWYSSPLKEKEDGSGDSQDTCYFGSRQSERFLRVYNKRGPTRLEGEFKGKRASLVANDLLSKDEKEWYPIMIGHVLDFIDIDKPWWKEFIRGQERRYAMIHSAKEKSLNQKINWLHHQVAPTLAAVVECIGDDELNQLIEEGKKRMRKSNDNLLSLHGK